MFWNWCNFQADFPEIFFLFEVEIRSFEFDGSQIETLNILLKLSQSTIVFLKVWIRAKYTQGRRGACEVELTQV